MERECSGAARLCLLLVLLAAACAGKPAQTGHGAAPRKVAFELPRPGVPWPADVPRCELPLDSQVTVDEFSLFRLATLDEAVVRLGFKMYGSTSLEGRLSQLPALARDRSAHFSLESPLAIEGFIALPRAAVIRRRIDVIDGHFWLPKGAVVSIEGTTGSEIVIQAETPFASPDLVEAKVPCDALDTWAYPDAFPSSGRPVRLWQHPIELFEAPHGRALVVFQAADAYPGDGPSIVVLERREGFVRIRASGSAGHCDRNFLSSTFEGWIREADVERSLGPDERDRSSCDGADDTDDCDHPTVTVSRTGPVSMGDRPAGAPIGTIAPGTRIEIYPKDVSARHYPFTFADCTIAPGRGRFWIERSSVNRDDGCPQPITVEVRAFTPGAVHDQFADGQTRLYDCTALTVLKPPPFAQRFQSKHLRICHDSDVPADSPWRRVGQRLRFELDESALEPGALVFEGAVQALEVL